MKRITLKKYEEILRRYREWRKEYSITVRPVSSPRIIVYHTPIQDASGYAWLFDKLYQLSFHWRGGEPSYHGNYYNMIYDYNRMAGTMVSTIRETPTSLQAFSPFTIPFYSPFDVFTEEELREGLILGDERWNKRDWTEHWEAKLKSIPTMWQLKNPMKIIITKENKWYGNKKS